MLVPINIGTALVILLIADTSRAVINSNSYDVTAKRELERMKKLAEFTLNTSYRRNVHILLS